MVTVGRPGLLARQLPRYQPDATASCRPCRSVLHRPLRLRAARGPVAERGGPFFANQGTSNRCAIGRRGAPSGLHVVGGRVGARSGRRAPSGFGRGRPTLATDVVRRCREVGVRPSRGSVGDAYRTGANSGHEHRRSYRLENRGALPLAGRCRTVAAYVRTSGCHIDCISREI